MSCQMEDGSVLTWAALSAYGTSKQNISKRKQIAERYTEVLQDVSLHLLEKENRSVTIQQKNASLHTKSFTKNCLADSNAYVMKQRAQFSERNPIGNIWGVMARQVYKDGNQFQSTNEIETVIVDAWSSSSLDFCRKLVESMPHRCICVTERSTQYYCN